MMKKASSIGYAAALATSPAWLTACTTQPTAQSEDPSVLFSLTSDAMHFEDPQGVDVTLVLDGVDPHTIWFTDRPARESGAMTTEQFVAQWADGGTFAQDPPNAALVLHEPVTVEDGSSTDTLVAEIQDATYDPVSRTVRADLHVLTDEEADAAEGNLGKHGDNHDAAWPNAAGAVSLFIDSVGLSAVASSTAAPGTPTGLKGALDPATAGQILLGWKAPSNLGGPASGVSYSVEQSTDNKTWTPATATVQGTVATVTGITGATDAFTVYLRVTATNSAGSSTPSQGTAVKVDATQWNGGSVSSKGVTAAPSAPRGLTVTKGSASGTIGTIDVAWYAPDSPGGPSGNVTYIVEQSTDEQTWTAATRAPINVLGPKASTTIQGLSIPKSPDSTVVYVRVTAKNSAGLSDPTTDASFTLSSSVWQATPGPMPTDVTGPPPPTVTLCSSPSDCAGGTTTNYTVNSTIYFTVSIPNSMGDLRHEVAIQESRI